jgi:hypothetical protein
MYNKMHLLVYILRIANFQLELIALFELRGQSKRSHSCSLRAHDSDQVRAV